MHALADRLSEVVILNRDWKSAVTPTLLQHTRTAPKPPVGVFLDPPYLLADRGELYDQDTTDDPARDAYLWAVEHGEVFRIAYACPRGRFPDTRRLGGNVAHVRRDQRSRRDSRRSATWLCSAQPAYTEKRNSRRYFET